jgi:hypothetical protein
LRTTHQQHHHDDERYKSLPLFSSFRPQSNTRGWSADDTRRCTRPRRAARCSMESEADITTICSSHAPLPPPTAPAAARSSRAHCRRGERRRVLRASLLLSLCSAGSSLEDTVTFGVIGASATSHFSSQRSPAHAPPQATGAERTRPRSPRSASCRPPPASRRSRRTRASPSCSPQAATSCLTACPVRPRLSRSPLARASAHPPHRR